MSNNLVLRPSYWASVSGGKDSLYMLKLILNNPDKYPLNGVVHFELEIDYPFIKNVIDYMENECKKYNIPFYRIKPDMTWMKYYEKYGFPNRQLRWCSNRYKKSCNDQFQKMLKMNGYKVIYYIGFCADEVNRFKNVESEIYPIANEGILESEILEWAKNVSIFNDYYKYNDRCGCMFCPLQSMKNTAYLAKYYPDEYEKMINLAKVTEKEQSKRLGKPFSVWQSNGKYDTEYRDKKIKEKYL